MSPTPFDFINLFVQPPGDLLYFLAVIAISQVGLFMALGQRLRSPEDFSAGRYTLTALGVVAAWVLLMVGALYALLTGQDPSTILPPLERAASVIAILLIGWAFISADNPGWARTLNIILLVLVLVVIVGYMLTGVQWPSLAPLTDFNLSSFGVAWTFVPAILALAGLLAVLANFRSVVDAPLKAVYFVVLLLGFGGALLQSAQGALIGDYAGATRLAFLASLPLLPAVIYRLVINRMEAAIEVAAPAALPDDFRRRTATQDIPAAPLEDIRRKTMTDENGLLVERESVQLLKALGMIMEDPTPTNIPRQIVLATLAVLKADVGALLSLQDANYADVTSAYDSVMRRPISGLALNLNEQPTLANAIERRMQRPLYTDRNVDELHDLYTRLDINQIGPTYFQPLTRGDDLIGILMIGMPYTGRELREGERELLKGVALISSSLLALSNASNTARRMAEERAIEAVVKGIPLEELEDDSILQARQEMQASLELARDQITELSHQVTQLKIELDYERGQMASGLSDTREGMSISQRIIALNDEQQKLREERDKLFTRLQEAETALMGATSPGNESVMQTVVDSIKRERDELVAQRDRLQAQLAELRISDAPVPQVVQDMLQSMSDEKHRLEAERSQMSEKLSDIEAQLKALGFEEGPAGLAQLIGQLHDQRTQLQNRVDSLRAERDMLANERTQLQDRITRENEREVQIQALQTQMDHLTADREAVTKQRDKLRIERDELLRIQEEIKLHRTQLLAESSGYQLELQDSHNEQKELQARLQALADERSALAQERDSLAAEQKALQTQLDQLIARMEGDRERLQQLGADGVGSLSKMISDITEERAQLERQLNEARARLSDLENQLEMVSVRVNAQEVPATYQHNNPELVLGLVQELRTPMTSIIGYIDLLMGESTGILGELQRKFLQRVLANINRLQSMLEDLIRVTALDTGSLSLAPQPVDVVSLIEDAITNSSVQFRDKGLTVHLDLDDDIPFVRADRDALTQIIAQLLTNAYLVSPPESEIFITAMEMKMNLSSNGADTQTPCLFVAVEDRGGGIAQEEEARVFSRKYKAENPLIQGLGDTGVGLSIAKALVEAHGGKLWLETRENIGSTFKFALPFNPVLQQA